MTRSNDYCNITNRKYITLIFTGQIEVKTAKQFQQKECLVRSLLLIPLLLLPSLSQRLWSQLPAASWSDHLSYNRGSFVAKSADRVYCSAKGGIIVYDRQTSSLSRLSTVTGLTTTGIATIAWSESQSALVIAYNNTRIDIYRGSVVHTIDDIFRMSFPGLKEIYRIETRGNHAYISGSMGIVIIDIGRYETADRWRPGHHSGANSVYDIAFLGDHIYAATAGGLFRAESDDPALAYFGNWSYQEVTPSGQYRSGAVAATTDALYASLSFDTGDSLFVTNGGSWRAVYHSPDGINTLEPSPCGGVITTVPGAILTIDQEGDIISATDSYGDGSPSPMHAISDGSTLWIADSDRGLMSVFADGSSSTLLPEGPDSNNVIHITAVDGMVYTAGGGVNNAWNNLWRPLQVSLFDGSEWRGSPGTGISDPLRVLPGRQGNHFVSTWGMGLLEFSGSTLINHYDESNSPLESIFPGRPYSRICGLAFDHNDNLWVTQSGVENNIKIMRPDRTWITLPVTIEAPTIGDIIVSRSGKKWIVLPRGHGLFVICDRNEPDNFGLLRQRKIVVRDSDERVLNTVHSIAEDLDGNIWLGTDQGPAVYYSPDNVFDSEIRVVRPRIARDDGSGLADYALGTEIITSIAVDGANRKWFATAGSGVYLLSPDGTATIKHFNSDNSPLLSDNVASVSADPSTGIVWFGTAEGIVAYRSDAPAGKESFDSVYAFPNPVRSHFSGPVTITGLVRDTKVRITDITGNLVYETTSTGAEATWDLNNFRGRRVATGVYLIMCSSPDGQSGTITKLLVVN